LNNLNDTAFLFTRLISSTQVTSTSTSTITHNSRSSATQVLEHGQRVVTTGALIGRFIEFIIANIYPRRRRSKTAPICISNHSGSSLIPDISSHHSIRWQQWRKKQDKGAVLQLLSVHLNCEYGHWHHTDDIYHDVWKLTWDINCNMQLSCC